MHACISRCVAYAINMHTIPTQLISGGQKRRVSLAAALIHNPSLLVLDEPCVGLDPLLRQRYLYKVQYWGICMRLLYNIRLTYISYMCRIWEYLTEISTKQGKTVIISTHYIEETKFCDKVSQTKLDSFINMIFYAYIFPIIDRISARWSSFSWGQSDFIVVIVPIHEISRCFHPALSNWWKYI